MNLTKKQYNSPDNYLCLMHSYVYELIRTFNILLVNDSVMILY